MARNAFRGFALAGLVGAGLSAALLPAPALSQEEGDTVVLTLRSGKKVTGTLISRNSIDVKVRVGSNDMTLPAGMVASVDKVGGVEPAPAPSDAAPAPDAAPAAGEAASGTPAAPGGAGAPRPVSIIMKSGKLLEVHVLAKSGTKIWVVSGKAQAIEETDIDEAFGSLEPTGGPKGLVLTGDQQKDAIRMVEELGCGVPDRVAAAWAVLKRMGREGVPAMIAGLKSKSEEARHLCIEGLTNIQSPEGLEPILSVLRNDPVARIRCSAAGRLGPWDSIGVRRAILDAVWQDRATEVKVTGLLALEKTAGPEEAAALIDLLTILPSDSEARVPLFRALKKATGQTLGPNADLWTKWWDDGGREQLSGLSDSAREARYKKEQALKFGASTEEEAPPEVPPPDVLELPPEAPPETPPEAPPETPPEGPK